MPPRTSMAAQLVPARSGLGPPEPRFNLNGPFWRSEYLSRNKPHPDGRYDVENSVVSGITRLTSGMTYLLFGERIGQAAQGSVRSSSPHSPMLELLSPPCRATLVLLQHRLD
jgi:hypothetical protein